MATFTEISLNQNYPAKEHASKVISCLKDILSSRDEVTGILYVEGQKTRLLEDSDEPVLFRQRRHFYYLTGCELSDCCFTYDIESGHSTLLLPPVDAENVMWQGLPMAVEEAKGKYEVDEVLTTDAINAHLTSKRLNKSKVWTIKDQVSSNVTFLPFGGTDFSHLKLAIDEARVTKTPYEIALLMHANRVSSAAHESLMHSLSRIKPKEAPFPSNERELYALFLQQCIIRGLPNQAYPAIVAGGVNAATLHYVKNDALLAGKLNVLVDAGAESSCYGADITRVIPLQSNNSNGKGDDVTPDGRFSPESRAIYALVLRMQEAAFEMMRPGVEWADIHAQVHHVLICGLLDLGILHNGTKQELFDARTSVAFFPHGLGHLLGMDVHDTGGRPNFNDADPMFKYLRLRRKLVKDFVVTVEPGCYFCRFIVEPALKDPLQAKYIDEKVLERYWNVGGVRIEDNAVITEDGYINLTTAPKQIDEIERIIDGTE